MQGKEILTLVDVLSNERAIEKEEVFSALEMALATAARRDFGKYRLKSYIDRKTGNYKIYRIWEVVDDNEPDFDSNYHIYDDQAEEKFGQEFSVGEIAEEFLSEAPLGRQAAQVFKQNIRENLKRAEKKENEKQFSKQIGEVFLVVVKRFLKGDVLVTINENTEGIIPKENLIPGDHFKVDQKINAMLYKVVDNYKGQQLILDRASGDFVKGMMKKEITEVANENILVRSVARRPGVKSLVMVEAMAPYIEPLRECIGPKGMRIKYVSENLNNEPVNLVEADKDEATTFVNMLSPIEPISIYINDENKSAQIALNEEDIEKAKGRTGLNEELMSELIGYKINFMIKEQFEDEQNQQINTLLSQFEQYLGVDEDLAIALVELGFEDITSVAYAPEGVFYEVEGFDKELVQELQNQAKEILQKEGDFSTKSELYSIESLTPSQVKKLEEFEIKTTDQLGELSVMELKDLVDIEDNDAANAIMKARERWF